MPSFFLYDTIFDYNYSWFTPLQVKLCIIDRRYDDLQWSVWSAIRPLYKPPSNCRSVDLHNAADSLAWKSLFYVTLFASFSRHNIKVCSVSNSFIVCLSICYYPISISLYLVSPEDPLSLRRGVTSCSRIWPRISRNSTHESLKLPPIRETI